MSNFSKVLAIYTQEFRTNVLPLPNSRVEHGEKVILRIGKDADVQANRILFSDLDSICANEIIRRQIQYFEELGHSFEWTVFDYDHPSDLNERLQAAGLESEPPEAVMVLDIRACSLAAPIIEGIEIRKITNSSSLGDIIDVQNQVWDEDHSWLQEMLAKELTEHSSNISIYSAYFGNRPISNAWIRYGATPSFASLNGGSTLPEFRGKGIYKALIDIRAAEAKLRSIPYLTVDASPMSRPILEKIGFKQICTATPHLWHCGHERRLPS